jgi:hypothetical protein
MSLNLSALNAWTDEHAMDLIKEAVLKGRTTDLVKVQGGVKHAATINRLSTNIIGQNGACGWNPEGTTTLDQRTISVNDIKINEAICLNDLEEFYTSVMMNPGSYNTEIPFEQLFAENKRDQITGLIEDLVWKGDVGATASGNLQLADGFLKLFDADGDVISGTYSASDSLVDTVDAMIADINPNIIDMDDLHIFISYANYRKYAKELRDANLFHYTGAEDQGAEFSQIHPGTNVRVIAVRGLNNTDKLVLSPASNLYVGTDLLNDAEDFRIFYSQDNDEVRFLAKWKLGVQVAYAEHVVYYEKV